MQKATIPQATYGKIKDQVITRQKRGCGRIFEMGRRMANMSSALRTGGPVMNAGLVFALFPLVFLGSPVDAQSPCSDCVTAAEEELHQCLDNAFSADDKGSCDESWRAHVKACSNRECKIERETGENRNEQQTPGRPGLTPYTPTEIEWLALIMRAGLRQDVSTDHPYSLDIIPVDHETLLIVVRYQPTVNREMMNRTIDTAREAIRSTAKRYGWDKWVKIRESVEMYPSQK